MPTKGPSEETPKTGLTWRLPSTVYRATALGVAAAVTLLLSFHAQGNNAQRAVEKLEKCSSQERSSGACVRILKRESIGGGKERIKAQLRSGRIIWYEFDKKTGAVRRVN